MSRIFPEKFPGTGINGVATETGSYTATEWPKAINFVDSTIRRNREAAMAGIEPLQLSERQVFALNHLALPAIEETLSEILGMGSSVNNLGRPFLSLLSNKDFEKYYERSRGPCAGVYFSSRNQIAINQADHTTDSPQDLAYFTKVFMHEYFHFLSHQLGHFDRKNTQLWIGRVGLMALGKDIRDTNKGEYTWDYFTASNEASTENLAIDAYRKIAHDTVFKTSSGTPATPFETYANFRELSEVVIGDAMQYQVTDLSKEDVWRVVHRGYITGDLKPLIRLQQATYPGLSVRAFGLMTNASDLPLPSDFVHRSIEDGFGRSSHWKLSEAYLARLYGRLNGKTARDYDTDVPPPPLPPPSRSAVAIRHTNDIQNHQVDKLRKGKLSVTADGRFVNGSGETARKDEHGNDIHYDQAWLGELLEQLIDVSMSFRSGAMSAEQAGKVIDQTLFNKRRISELSSGFEEFYVAKHLLLDPNIGKADFDAVMEEVQQKLSSLQARAK